MSVLTLGWEDLVIKEEDTIVWENHTFVKEVKGISDGNEESHSVIFDMGSGTYCFKVSEARR